RSGPLTSSFSLTELLDACRRTSGGVRDEVPICASLSDLRAPRSATTDAHLVDETRSWCGTPGRRDRLCAALLLGLMDQLGDARLWRQPTLSCASGCAPAPV